MADILEPLTVTVQETCRLVGVRPTTVYKLIKEGRLEARKVLDRTVITYRSIKRLALGEEAA
jgi:excisionase family DNA binding protein